MKDGWASGVFLAFFALVMLGVGLLVGFFGAVMILHGAGSGWIVLLVAAGCCAGALRIVALLLPERS